VPSFCRHGRLEANCPICSRNAKDGLVKPVRPTRPAARREPRPAASVATRRRAQRKTGDLRVRREARAADDGYQHDLVPGLRASADALRLAHEIAFAAARLDELATDPPGLYAEVGASADAEEAIWLAFLIAYLGPLDGDEPFAGIEAARTTWAAGEPPRLDGVRTGPRSGFDARHAGEMLNAYRAWAARAGSQEAALVGDPSWTPERRFERAFERLAVRGFARGPRYELLVSLGHLGVIDLRPTSLHLVEPLDPAVVSAKRIFGIGDAINLRRRSAALARDAGLPIEALDLALVNFARPAGERVAMGARVTGADREASLEALLGLGADEEPAGDE
jgi:hypothetical protein